MKDTYTYKVSVSVDKKDSFGSISWEETFSRDDVKGFFSPKENTYYDLLYLPELFTPEEAASLTPEEIAEKVPEGTIDVFVRVDQNKLWWVKKDGESGSVDIW